MAIQFEALAKWEQNMLAHSPGKVLATDDCVQFNPGMMSLLGKQITISWDDIQSVEEGDNFALRGVVKIHTKQPVGGRDKYIFFLGGKRKEFMTICSQKGVV